MVLSKKTVGFKAALDAAYADLNNHKIGTDEHERALQVVERLERMKKDQKIPFSLSFDIGTLVSIIGSIVVAVLVTRFEKEHVISTKTTSFLPRGR